MDNNNKPRNVLKREEYEILALKKGASIVLKSILMHLVKYIKAHYFPPNKVAA